MSGNTNIDLCYMNTEYDKEFVLKEFEIIVALHKPAFIKKVKAVLTYDDSDMDDGKKCLVVAVEVYMETEDSYTYVPWVANADSYKSSEEREKLKEELEENLINTLREDLDEDYTMNYWVGRDLEKETWVKKGD